MTRGLLTPSREKLPPRRRTTTITPKLTFGAPGSEASFEFHVTLGFYDDGRPGEVFVKASTHLDSALSFVLEDAAVLISNLLQRGCTLKEVQGMVARGHDVAASIIASLLDAIAAEESMPPIKRGAA